MIDFASMVGTIGALALIAVLATLYTVSSRVGQVIADRPGNTQPTAEQAARTTELADRAKLLGQAFDQWLDGMSRHADRGFTSMPQALTCDEVDQLAELLARAGHTVTAAKIIAVHAYADTIDGGPHQAIKDANDDAELRAWQAGPDTRADYSAADDLAVDYVLSLLGEPVGYALTDQGRDALAEADCTQIGELMRLLDPAGTYRANASQN